MEHMNMWRLWATNYTLKRGMFLLCFCLLSWQGISQHTPSNNSSESGIFNPAYYNSLKWRNVGPYRGGRSVAVAGVPDNPMLYYMGSTGGGLWKTTDAGLNWVNISDGFFNSGSVGAIAIAPSDPNILYVGMGEHAVRGVMTSHGDGVYRSDDAGKTWTFIGLQLARHIAEIQVHPRDPDHLYVAVQGALYGPSETRGVYRSLDGGKNWQQILYIDEQTGASDLSMDIHNPRILYAGMWDHQRKPWEVRSGGPGSGIYKSTDGGENWTLLNNGLPEEMGKVGVAVSQANPDRVFAIVEAENGGVFRSDDGGESWRQTTGDRLTIARAWYYIEIFPDPQDEETVYVLNAPFLKSVDGGKSFKPIENPHGDQHDLWINPKRPDNMILANDGGACITFNGGASWSTQANQPTAQFYRVITDNRFPYYIYGGQQDNSTIAIASRTFDGGIGAQNWYEVSGGESAFLAFDPNNPVLVYGGSYQGNITVYDDRTKEKKDIMAYPTVGLATLPKDMKYRFNWNAPIVVSPQDPSVIYHAGNVVLRTTDGGMSWAEISGDLTRNEKDKQGPGGGPYTNEGAGGENYNTISYLACSPHDAGVIWAGSDDGLVHLTRNGGESWENVTPKGMGETLVNSIEVSPHDPAVAYLAATSYRFNDLKPMIYRTSNYGKSWEKITNGIGPDDFVRVVREDQQKRGLLFAGTENGLYLSFDNGNLWHRFQNDLPVCPITDLTIRDNDLIAATSGRGFWILDDIGVLQQSQGWLANGKLRLFQPKATVRIDAPPSKEINGLGQNPLPGLIIDYYLPRELDTLELKLEILDSKGIVIRDYSNQKDPDFKTFTGGPKEEVLLPSNRGINRFSWDLRREGLPAVNNVFVLGDYRGSLVPPGAYTLRLSGPDGTLETKATITADPRLEVSRSDFEDQSQCLKQIEGAVREIHESVNELRRVKKQVEYLNGILTKMDDVKDLIDTGKMVVDRINQWEASLIQSKQETYQDVINFPNQLNSELLNLKTRIDTHDPRITQGARQRLRDLLDNWQTHKEEWQEIVHADIALFNRLYAERGIPALYVPASNGDKP